MIHHTFVPDSDGDALPEAENDGRDFPPQSPERPHHVFAMDLVMRKSHLSLSEPSADDGER